MNLYILSEERPKSEVIHEILKIYSELTSNVVHVNTNIEIIPVINDKQHDFTYDVKGVEVEGINEIKLFIASGHSSFVDFLVFEQEEKPLENGDNNLLFLVEETKTSDQESRNVSAYQRHAKFIYADYHYPNTPKFMLYNKENNHDKKPSNTNKLGTNLLLTQNIKIIGKDLTHFKKFESSDELIDFKNKMKGRKGNVAIQITKFEDRIEVSGRLSKPANAGNIEYDPNIGILTSIPKTLRVLEWDKKIVITQHGVKQEKVNNMNGNKFLKIASILDIELEGITFEKLEIPDNYWYYESNSEKLGTILLHLLAINSDDNIKGIFENHASGERGYLYTLNNEHIPFPKNDDKEKFKLPDLILRNDKYKEILLIEGKQSKKLNQGLEEIKQFNLIEKILIKYYPNYSFKRWVVTYGNDIYHNNDFKGVFHLNDDGTCEYHNHSIYHNNLNDKVLFHLNDDGTFYVNKNSPVWIKNLFSEF